MIKQRPLPPSPFMTADLKRSDFILIPWLPGLADRIANNPDWGPYLAARARLIIDLADQIRASSEAATWAAEQDRVLPAGLITDLQVWRAAMQVEAADLGQPGLNNEVFLREHGSTDSPGDSASRTRLKISSGRRCSPS
jgi:predicted membrane protein